MITVQSMELPHYYQVAFVCIPNIFLANFQNSRLKNVRTKKQSLIYIKSYNSLLFVLCYSEDYNLGIPRSLLRAVKRVPLSFVYLTTYAGF